MKTIINTCGLASLLFIMAGCSASVGDVGDAASEHAPEVSAMETPATTPAEPSPDGLPEGDTTVAVAEVSAAPEDVAESPSPQPPTMDQILSELQIPPPWLDSVELDFDMSLPWNKAWDRIEVLLQTAEETERRQAVKLAYLYQQDGRARIGYPAAVYFLAGEYAWAIRELDALEKDCTTHMRMASCYLHFDQHDLALASLSEAEQQITEAPPWDTFRRGQVLEARGDVYAARGDVESARENFREALTLYEKTELPANQQLAKNRSVTNLGSKLEMLDQRELVRTSLADGEFTGHAPGYSDTIQAHVTIARGKIADIDIRHAEKADLQSTRIIPERILAQQDVNVDAISGATITSQAVRNAVFQALKQAAGIGPR